VSTFGLHSRKKDRGCGIPRGLPNGLFADSFKIWISRRAAESSKKKTKRRTPWAWSIKLKGDPPRQHGSMSLLLFALRPRANNRRLGEPSPWNDRLHSNMQMDKDQEFSPNGNRLWPRGRERGRVESTQNTPLAALCCWLCAQSLIELCWSRAQYQS